MSIPKVLHRCWLGPAPVPPDAERYWTEFEKMHPDWELRTWTDSDDYGWMKNREVFDSADTWVSKSDVLRYELLHEFGGVYVDTDIEPKRSLDKLLVHEAFAGYEDDRFLCGAVVGATPHHPAVRALLDAMPGWVSGHREQTADYWLGPKFLTAQWTSRDDVKLFPSRTFYPYSWKEQGLRGPLTPATFTVHHWTKLWAAVDATNETDVPKISVIMPWVDRGDKQRGRVKAWTERWWAANFPEAELLFGSDTREPFNRSACINEAAKRAAGDVLIVTDADAVVHPATVRELVSAVSGKRLWGNPFRDVYRMTNDATNRILKKDPESYVPPALPSRVTYETVEKSLAPRYGGFVVVVPREGFEAVGGFDERFEGWGSEDVAFTYALDTLWGPHWSAPVPSLHLWHKRPVTTLASEKNKRMEKEYERARWDRAVMAKICGVEPTTPAEFIKPFPGWVTTADDTPLPKVSVLVPFRAEESNPIRQEIWDWLARRWAEELPEFELVVGEDDGTPFSKTSAVNDAYWNSTGEILVVADADALLQRDHVMRAARKALKTGRLVLPYSTQAWRVSEAGTRKLLDNPVDCAVDVGDDAELSAGPPRNTAGGVFVMTRTAFETVQGMDPRFRGWGYEDVSFYRCCKTMLGDPMSLQGQLRLMWHPYKKERDRRVWVGDDGNLNRDLRTHYLHAMQDRRAMQRLCEQHKLGEEPGRILPVDDFGGDTISEEIFQMPTLIVQG